MARPRRERPDRVPKLSLKKSGQKFTLTITPEQMTVLMQQKLRLTAAEVYDIQLNFPAVLAFQHHLEEQFEGEDPCILQPPCDPRTFWRFHAGLHKHWDHVDALAKAGSKVELEEVIRRYWEAYRTTNPADQPAPVSPPPVADESVRRMQEEVDRLRAAGCPWTAIADRLNTVGWQPPGGGRWQGGRLRQAWQKWQTRSSLSSLSE